jgi:hypothetical protein
MQIEIQKNYLYGIIALLSIIIIVAIAIYFYYTKYQTSYTSVIGKWNQNNCNNEVDKTILDIFNESGIAKSDTDWNIYLPCLYNEIDKEISQMPIKKGAKYFIVSGTDEFVGKDLLWKNILAYYGLEKAQKIMPKSYIMYDKNEMLRFADDYDTDKLYIMKKNTQRQEGIAITKNIKQILRGKDDDYVILQELLQNPYTIDDRKINMRFYILIVHEKSITNVYVYNDGFMYYTKVPFQNNSTNIDVNITTGYIDRSVYESNPLTHQDFKKYLKENGNMFFENVYKLIGETFIPFKGKIGTNPVFVDSTQFQLFGVDIAVNKDLTPLIMEINKGPDMGAKDERDSQLKHNVVRDMLKTLGVTTNINNGFIKVL